MRPAGRAITARLPAALLCAGLVAGLGFGPSAWATHNPPYCEPDAMPTPADPQEEDDTAGAARFEALPSVIPLRNRSFSDDTDEDWIQMYLVANRDGSGMAIPYRLEVLNYGAGVPMTTSDGGFTWDSGTGIRLEVFQPDGSTPLEVATVPVDSGADGCNDLLDQFNNEERISVQFTVPTDDFYFVRVSQCRNIPGGETIWGNACIPDDTTYDFQANIDEGFDPGLLSGLITEAGSGNPLPSIFIEAPTINNFTFSLNPDGGYALADTTTSGSTTSATINPAGMFNNPAYETAVVDFELVPGMVTDCDVSLAGTAGSPALDLTPDVGLDFGMVATSTTSTAMTATLTNTGTADATNVATVFNGDFSAMTDNCNGTTLMTGNNCTVDVVFSPTADGTRNGMLTASADGGVMDAINLTGEGFTPPTGLDLTPDGGLDFGTIGTGFTSATMTATLTNTSGGDATNLVTAFTGDFAAMTDNCNGITLGNTANCTIEVVFSPTVDGMQTGSLMISADGGLMDTIALRGTGQEGVFADGFEGGAMTRQSGRGPLVCTRQ